MCLRALHEALPAREGLLINEKKTLYKSLTNENDSVRFPGINLIRRKDKYDYSISTSYLMKTSKMIQRCLNHPKDIDLLLKTRGRVAYIRYVSQASYSKLQRIVKAKLGSLPSSIFPQEKQTQTL